MYTKRTRDETKRQRTKSRQTARKADKVVRIAREASRNIKKQRHGNGIRKREKE